MSLRIGRPMSDCYWLQVRLICRAFDTMESIFQCFRKLKIWPLPWRVLQWMKLPLVYVVGAYKIAWEVMIGPIVCAWAVASVWMLKNDWGSRYLMLGIQIVWYVRLAPYLLIELIYISWLICLPAWSCLLWLMAGLIAICCSQCFVCLEWLNRDNVSGFWIMQLDLVRERVFYGYQ